MADSRTVGLAESVLVGYQPRFKVSADIHRCRRNVTHVPKPGGRPNRVWTHCSPLRRPPLVVPQHPALLFATTFRTIRYEYLPVVAPSVNPVQRSSRRVGYLRGTVEDSNFCKALLFHDFRNWVARESLRRGFGTGRDQSNSRCCTDFVICDHIRCRQRYLRMRVYRMELSFGGFRTPVPFDTFAETLISNEGRRNKIRTVSKTLGNSALMIGNTMSARTCDQKFPVCHVDIQNTTGPSRWR